MNELTIFERYRRLQAYVGWTDEHARHVQSAKSLIEDEFAHLVDDFYSTIQSEPAALKVITGGPAQIARLKLTLHAWLDNLFSGPYDDAYVEQRWRVGWRHVEIGLEQALVNVAMSRLRDGLLAGLEQRWNGPSRELCDVARSISRLIDLDLAIIQDAYETEYVRRQRVDERRRSEIAFRNLVEAAGSMIVILREDQSIAYINPFVESLTRFVNDDVYGHDFADLMIPDGQRDPARQRIQRAIDGESTRDYECGVSGKDSQRWVIWNIRRIEDFSHAPAVLLVGQDITERVGAEERALQAERLAAIGQTIAGMAHESRNAFQRSQAALDVLEFELEQQPELLELVDRVKRSLGHLHRLYEEVRDYAAPIRLDRQECDLAKLWRSIWSQLDVRRQDLSIELQEQSLTEEPLCNVDWFSMGQVFRNLFENGIDACEEGGTIHITCREMIRRHEPGFEVTIQDSGPGVPADVCEEIFKPFFTTRPKGTGLGLAITKRIVEAHGGDLTLEECDDGAKFKLWVPIHSAV